jgi:hypothetical protein
VKEEETVENNSFLEEDLVTLESRSQSASSEQQQQQPSTEINVTNQSLYFFCYVSSFYFLFENLLKNLF